MKSKRAEEHLKDHIGGFPLGGYVNIYYAEKAVELAEEEMVEKARRLFEKIMSGVFQGETLKRMAEEFKQKLME